MQIVRPTRGVVMLHDYKDSWNFGYAIEAQYQPCNDEGS